MENYINENNWPEMLIKLNEKHFVCLESSFHEDEQYPWRATVGMKGVQYDPKTSGESNSKTIWGALSEAKADFDNKNP